jgi:hypothetical protein
MDIALFNLVGLLRIQKTTTENVQSIHYRLLNLHENIFIKYYSCKFFMTFSFLSVKWNTLL